MMVCGHVIFGVVVVTYTRLSVPLCIYIYVRSRLFYLDSRLFHLWPHNLKLKMSSGGGGGHITTRQGNGTILVSPRNESDQSASIIICHGLGDTAEGFVDVAEQLSRQLPYVKFILPTAPTQKVTMNMGMACLLCTRTQT